MACLDEKPDVGVHKADCHGDVLPIWKDGTPVSSALLDEAEDIIPAKRDINPTFESKNMLHEPSTVQTRGMVPQLEKDFLHLERSREGLNENGSADRVMRDADIGLGKDKDIVPKTRFKTVFHFREVEVWPRPALDELMCIVIEVEGKVEDRSRDGGVIYRHAGFIEVPSSRTETYEVSRK